MSDPGYFTKLRRFLTGHHQRPRNTSRRARRGRSSTRSDLAFTLEALEPRVLLSADLAGAATQVIETVPAEAQPAAVVLLDQQSGANGSVIQEDAYGNLPLSFEANQGQTDREVSFLSRGDGYSLSLTDDGAVLSLRQDDGSAPTVLTMEMVGANPDAMIMGEQLLPGVANYFIGNDPSQWRTEIPTYAQVQYDEVYTGIDLLYYGNQGQLEYDFVVAPGADPGTIQLRFTGADQVTLNEQGDLVLQVGSEQLTVQRPVLYQQVNGERQEISGSFVLNENGTIGFQVGAYDRAQPLVIDPVLIYSTYLGGSNGDRANGLGLDNAGNVYITGVTFSNNLPTPVGGLRGGEDMFVTRLNATGTAVDYSTYLGGSGGDITDDGKSVKIAVDGAGNAYVSGTTISSDFPTTAGAFDRTFNDVSGVFADGFVTRLDPNGLVNYSTYLGGSSSDFINGIAVHAGQIYVAGATQSFNYPTTSGAHRSDRLSRNISAVDAFVTKLNPAGAGLSDLVYSTYVGGSVGDGVNGIAVDGQGQAYITGESDFFTGEPPEFHFPIVLPPGADQPGFAGGPSDAFVSKLNSDGTGLIYSRYLGGGFRDVGQAIAVDSSGHAYVTGGGGVPATAGAFQTDAGGERIPTFVTKLDPTGARLVYSTFVRGVDFVNEIAVDSEGKVAVTGSTVSNSFVTKDALQPVRSAEPFPLGDAVVAVLNREGSGLVYASYLGGNSADVGTGIAWDAAGALYVAGHTSSTNFPTTNSSFQASPQGGGDAFITKIGLTPPNQAPVANSQSELSTPEDTARIITLTGSDPEGAALTFTIETPPTNGSLSAITPLTPTSAQVTYTPTGNFNGSDSFTFVVSDGNSSSTPAIVSISVTAVNDAPIANAGPDQTVQGGTVTLDGTASSDLEGNTPLTFAWTLTKPAGSTASLVNPTSSQPTFTPDVVGDYTVRLVVTDTLGTPSVPDPVNTLDTVIIHVVPLTVTIDIKPGSFPNSINRGAGGTVPVAIFSTETFDATKVNPSTVTLASAPVNLRGKGEPQASREDVNRDGRLDLIVHVTTQELQLSETDTEAVLTGRTSEGIFIRGTNPVRVVQ